MYTFQQKNDTRAKEFISSSESRRSHIPASHDIRIHQRTEGNIPIQRQKIFFLTLELDTQKSMAIPILTYIEYISTGPTQFKEYIGMAIDLLSGLQPADEERRIIDDTIYILNSTISDMDHLSQTDIDAIKDWTGGVWDPINKYLRNQMGEQELEPFQKRELILGKYGKGNLDERVFAIDSALNKMKSYSAGVYRYSSVQRGFFNQIGEGDFLYDAGYTAASKIFPKDRIKLYSKHESVTESEITFVIFAFPKGTHNGKDISKLSTSPGEAEVLLDKGGFYRILEKKIKDGVGYVTLEKATDMNFSKNKIRNIYTGEVITRQTISKNITIAGTAYSYAPDAILRDGNCFFNAVITAMGLFCSSKDLRNALADRYHTEYIRGNGIWAQREDIAHLAAYLRIRIEVFLINEGAVVYNEGFGNSEYIIRLALENNHFSPLTQNQP